MVLLQKLNFLLLFIYSIILVATTSRRKRHVRLLTPSSNMSGHIVKGVPVPIQKYPYNALLYNYDSICGSSIIHSRAVLTAAHCFAFNTLVDYIKIFVGSEYYDSDKAVMHDVLKIQIHAKFDEPVDFSNDIALVFVKKPFKFNKKVQQVSLVNTEDWKNTHLDKDAFTVTGWGTTKAGGVPSKYGLLMVRLKLIPLKTCRKLNRIFHITDDMFCLYGDGERDTCQGDSGGGVVWNNMLMGIVSFGDGCAFKDKPGIYINVYKYRKWIENMISNFNFYCRLS